MNRRNCLKLLAAVLPCAFVARMLGEKDLKINPAWESATHEFQFDIPKPLPVQPYTSGFHVEIRELPERGMQIEDRWETLPPCFQAVIRDCKTNLMTALQSAGWVDGVKDKRIALQGLYRSVAYVLQRRQFPADTKIYDVEKTPTGLKWINPRYPNETNIARRSDSIVLSSPL